MDSLVAYVIIWCGKVVMYNHWNLKSRVGPGTNHVDGISDIYLEKKHKPEAGTSDRIQAL